MPDSSKPTDWLNKIPSWLKAAFGLVGTIAAFIIAFRDNWRLYTTIAVFLTLVYLLGFSLYILLKRRALRSKKGQYIFLYAKYRPWGLLGLATTCLLFIGLLGMPSTRQIAQDGIFGTPTPTPLPKLPSPDVLIAPFDPQNAASVRIDVANRLKNDLQSKLNEFGLNNVTVRVGSTPIGSEDEVQKAAFDSGSKVLIWGWYDDLGIQVNLYLSGGEDIGQALPGTKEFPLYSAEESSTELSVVIREVVPQNVSFLSLFVIGHLAYLSNNYQAGHKAFDAAMAQLPSSEDVRFENQDIWHFFQARQMDRAGGDPNQVICEYVKAIEIDPEFDVAYNNLGLVISKMQADHIGVSQEANLCLEKLGLAKNYVDLAPLLFQRAVLANPNLTIAKYNQYAVAWLQSVSSGPWIRLEMEEIQRQDPGIMGTYIILADMKDHEGDPAGAIQMYQSGIAVEPNLPLFHVNLGQLYWLYEKNVTKAENEFLEAVRLDANDVEAHLALGHFYYRQGRLAEAASQMDQVILAEPVNQTSWKTFRYVHALHSAILFAEGQTTEAIEAMHRAYEEDSMEVLYPFVLGLLYQQQGDNVQAAESFRLYGVPGGYVKRESSSLWGVIGERCFTDETYSMPFADWALTKLPSSTCLPADPRERILAVYDILNEPLFALRELPKMIILGAQCPYVYTENPVTGEWEFGTTILYKIVDREAAQMRPLTQFNGRLLIREEEPEISHLNHLYVLAQMSDGSTRILEPDVQALKGADDDYIVLHRGEEILVSFNDHPLTGEVSRWWVMAVGYYTPLQ